VTTLLKDNCGTDVTVLLQDKDIIVRSGSFHTTYRPSLFAACFSMQCPQKITSKLKGQVRFFTL